MYFPENEECVPCLLRRMFFLPGGNELQKSVISSKEAKRQILSTGEANHHVFLSFLPGPIVFLGTSFQAIEIYLDPSQPSIRFQEVMISPGFFLLNSCFWIKGFSQVLAQHLVSLAFDILQSSTLV